MKRKQGFTLIELLAVIVILAVIALIATPLIMGTITKAKKNAFKDTAYGILKAGEKYTAELLLENENTYTGETIHIPESGSSKKLEYKGQEPKGGQMFINGNGDISIMIYNDSFCAIKNASDKDVKVEKYNKDTCKLNPFLNQEIISKNTSNNTEGLFTDDFGNTRYRGAPSEVKNYIKYNNEVWRIIGVFDGRVKIIRNTSIGNKAWNLVVNNNWDTSTLKVYLNGEYYNGLSTTAKSQIDIQTYYLGGHNTTEGMYSKTIYEKERENAIYPGNQTSTNQVFGVMYPSDYGYAARSSCSKDLWNYSEDMNCSTEGNWLYILNTTQWLQTPRSDTASSAFGVYYTGGIGPGNNVTGSFAVRPVVYLKSNIEMTGGDGTSANPYTIQ